MYLPPYFATDDPEALHKLMQAHPLGALITHGERGLDANHLPFELDTESGKHGVLRAHVARNNPLWQEARDGDEVLVIFKAADAYISPNWYPSKKAHHQQVPTWNYSVVHAHGRIQIRDDARFVRRLLANLTRHHEAGEPTPWKMADAPPRLSRGQSGCCGGNRNRDNWASRQVQTQSEQGGSGSPRGSSRFVRKRAGRSSQRHGKPAITSLITC